MALHSRLVIYGLAIGLIAALMSLGIPRLITAFVAMPASPVLWNLQKQRNVDHDNLINLISAQEKGLNWVENSRRWTDLGFAQIMLAEKQVETTEQQSLYAQARHSLRKGLSLGPANPFAWVRLAYIDIRQGKVTHETAEYLRKSIQTGPHEPRLVLTRLKFVFLLWSYFKKEERTMLLNQMRFAWFIDADETVTASLKAGQIGALRAALLKSPEDFARLEQMIRKNKPVQ